MIPKSERIYNAAKILVSRLERLSADSIWARRASGMRGSLIKGIADFESDGEQKVSEELESLVYQGFELLTKAAYEIPDIEKILKD